MRPVRILADVADLAAKSARSVGIPTDLADNGRCRRESPPSSRDRRYRRDMAIFKIFGLDDSYFVSCVTFWAAGVEDAGPMELYRECANV